MSVFREENKILRGLRSAEAELESCDPSDGDKMQEILDRMQDLQAKADAKDVTSLESRAEKTMDLMGFDNIDAKLPVSSFSGGWKMRIGLGKVLLKVRACAKRGGLRSSSLTRSPAGPERPAPRRAHEPP